MAYLIPIILLLFGFTFPKSKWVTFAFVAYFLILMGFNTYTPDYEEYEKFYGAIWMYPYLELGFQGLCLLGNILGLSFQEFRIMYAAVFAFFTFVAVKRLTPFPNYVLALFLLWPFIPGVSGIRQSLANMIMCCGFPCLFKSGRIQIVKYVLWVGLAYLIHQSSLFFLLFIFARIDIGVKEKRMIYLIVILGVIIMSGSRMLGDLLALSDNHKLDKWLNINGDQNVPHPNFWGFAIRSLLVCLYAYVVPRMRSIVLRYGNVDENTKKRLLVCCNTSIILLISIPGFVVTAEFQRFMYASLLIYYVLFADFKYSEFVSSCKHRKQLLLMSYIIIFATIWYYWFSMRNHDLMATFTDNLIFR